MSDKSKVILYLDDETVPIGEFNAPVQFELDTLKITDGRHELRIISKAPDGREGIRKVPFTVRNGPAIVIEGVKPEDVVDGVLPLMINAYSKGDQKKFLIEGSETPRSIPSWMWALIILFAGWSAYYFISSFVIM